VVAGARDMADETSESARLAVLIDADNARPSVVQGLLAEVAKYGVAGVRRIYGDLDDAEPRGVEGGAAGPLDPAGAAVPLHRR
jgi:hypothetical protein